MGIERLETPFWSGAHNTHAPEASFGPTGRNLNVRAPFGVVSCTTRDTVSARLSRRRGWERCRWRPMKSSGLNPNLVGRNWI